MTSPTHIMYSRLWNSRHRCQCDDVLTYWQRQPAVTAVIVIVIISVVTFVTMCVTYDTQLFYTPANFVRDHHAVPVRPVFKSVPQLKDPRIKKILLVPYHRGGSSFLGEMFGENPDAFYWYEPLRNMYREFPARLRTHLDVVEQFYEVTPEHNLTFLARPILDLIVRNIEATLSCDVSRIDSHILSEEFMLRWVHMPRVRAYSECMIFNFDNVFGPQICAEILRLTCLQSDVIVTKTLRTPVYVIAELLDRNPDIKVIYYVRDPRAILMSRADRFGDTQEEMAKKAKFFCQQLLEDYKHYVRTKQRYPDNIELIKYEDLAYNPTEMARYIYNYANITFPPSLEEWIIENTRASKSDGRIGTLRNSTATANKWLHLMDEQITAEITETCRPVLLIHGYEN